MGGHKYAQLHPTSPGGISTWSTGEAAAATPPGGSAKVWQGSTEPSPPPGWFPPFDKDGISHIELIVGNILYYARAIDMTVLPALSTLTSKQTIVNTAVASAMQSLW